MKVTTFAFVVLLGMSIVALTAGQSAADLDALEMSKLCTVINSICIEFIITIDLCGLVYNFYYIVLWFPILFQLALLTLH